jgi:hypothetical protein
MQKIYNDFIVDNSPIDNILGIIHSIRSDYDIMINKQPDHVRIISIKTTNLYLYIYANHLSILLENIEGQDNLVAHNEAYIKIVDNLKLSSGNLDSFFSNLSDIFGEQYMLCMKMFDKYKQQLLSLHPNDTILQFLDENLYTPITFKRNLLDLSKNINHQDLIDIECYKGTGLFYIYLNPDFPALDAELLQNMPEFDSLKRFCILPTLGDNGHFLPEPGFSLVVKHGLSYFENSEINGFQIGNIRSFMIKSRRSGQFKKKKYTAPVYIETHVSFEADHNTLDEMIIDGVSIIGYFYDTTYM